MAYCTVTGLLEGGDIRTSKRSGVAGLVSVTWVTESLWMDRTDGASSSMMVAVATVMLLSANWVRTGFCRCKLRVSSPS